MNSLTDQQLVQEYASNRSEVAFAEILRRHVDLVYSAAMRMIRDAQLAEDVTQATFLALAQNAGRLEKHCVLSGWLHRTARNLAVKVIRSDVRRRAREEEAVAMNELQTRKAEDVWEHIAPQLDDALLQLKEPDRSVLMLRFFERKSAQEMAEIMGTTPEAAQKRTNRAVERLRHLFARRGVTVGASGLVAIIAANAVHGAPAGLAASISTAAGNAATAATAAITKTIAMTTTQKLLAVAVVAGCLVTPLWFEQNAQAKLDTQKKLLQERMDRLGGLQTENVALSNRLTHTTAAPDLPSGELAELLRLRGRAGSLRKQVEAASRNGKPQSREDMLAAIAAQYSQRVSQIKEKLDAMPEEKIPELQYLTDRDWRDLAWSSEDDTNFAKTASTVRGWAQNNFVNDFLYPALQQYAKQNNNAMPTDLSQLKPYFPGAVDDSTLQRWEIVPANQLAPYMTEQALGPGDDELIAPKAPVNPTLDMPTVFALNKVTAFAGRPANVWVRAQQEARRMNRYKIIATVALIAAILWVLAIADGARMEMARGEALLRSLESRLQAQEREKQRLSELLKEANDPAAKGGAAELAKLRSEMASLRDLTNSLGRKLAELRQAGPTRTAFKRSEGFMGGVTVVSDSVSPQYQEQLSKMAMDRKQHPEMGDGRSLRFAIRGYEQYHGGAFPDNLQAVAPYVYQGNLPLAGTEKGRDPMAGMGEFDLVFQGSLNDLADVPTQTVALLRQEQAWPTPSGKSARIYVMVGGKVEVVESDDNFQSWEAAHVLPPSSGGL